MAGMRKGGGQEVDMHCPVGVWGPRNGWVLALSAGMRGHCGSWVGDFIGGHLS